MLILEKVLFILNVKRVRLGWVTWPFQFFSREQLPPISHLTPITTSIYDVYSNCNAGFSLFFLIKKLVTLTIDLNKCAK